MALAPALLLMAYLPGETMLRCRIDGLLRAACCCPEQTEAPGAQAAIKAAGCCERAVVAAHERPAMETSRATDEQISTETAAPAIVSFVPSLPERPDLAPVGAAQRYGPAHDGPPIVLLKHAFLI